MTRHKGNHTGYRQWKGTRVSAQEITDLYEGLKQSYLDDFDMMLSGYIPGAEAVRAVGDIAKELKEKTKGQPGDFFWVLDPVMGDNGKIYVAEDVVPAYKSLIPYADLILPNQFEAEYAFGTPDDPFTLLYVWADMCIDFCQRSRSST
jgi:pyridoxine kinase